MFSDKEFNIWESISDLMTGLMMIFLFIVIAFLFELQETQRESVAIKSAIYEKLREEFPTAKLEEWGAIIDPKTMAVKFVEPDVLFGFGQSTVQPRFQEILRDFFPRYIKVLTLPEFEGKIAEIRIEGYASLDNEEYRNSDTHYFYNMSLSQDRARNVLQYIFGIPELADKKDWLRENIITNGYSFGKASGSSQEERRVEFSFVTTAERETVSTLIEEWEK